MSRLRLSVAMCTYNGSRYLREQLESIETQQNLPCELIVCDDTSSDDTVRLLTKFAARASFPVHVEVNKERLGPAANFEKCIKKCQGEIILLADQDDIWKPHKVRRLEDALNDHPDASYVFSDAHMVDEKATPSDESLWEAVGLQRKLEMFSGCGQLEILLPRNFITGATMGFRASFRSVVLPIPSGWMHDYWIALLGSVFNYGVPVPDSLLLYRQHASQACGWRKKTFMRVIKESLATKEDDLQEKVLRFRELLNRVASVADSINCPTGRLELLQEKALHLSKRADIRASTGLTRIMKVIAEARIGRYKRFSPSWLSIVRDL